MQQKSSTSNTKQSAFLNKQLNNNGVIKMTNISNFTISENMNARLAEYGLTSAMAEENGWTLCDSIEIQRILDRVVNS